MPRVYSSEHALWLAVLRIMDAGKLSAMGSFRRHTWRVAFVIGGALALIPSGRADSNLLENSPFLPAGAAQAAAQRAPLELRGIVKDGAAYEFSIYDPAKKQSTWVGLNEPGLDFVVRSFDANRDIITVEKNDRTFALALKEARILPMAAAPVGPKTAADTQEEATTDSGRQLSAQNYDPVVVARSNQAILDQTLGGVQNPPEDVAAARPGPAADGGDAAGKHSDPESIAKNYDPAVVARSNQAIRDAQLRGINRHLGSMRQQA